MLSMMASSSSVSASTTACNIARGGATTTRSGRVPIRSVLNDRNSLLVAKKINTTNTISRRNNRGELVVSNGLFGLGLPELVVIGGVTALLFGPSKLPELGKSLGKTVKSFQSAANEFNEELKKEVKEGEKENEGAKKEEEEEK